MINFSRSYPVIIHDISTVNGNCCGTDTLDYRGTHTGSLLKVSMAVVFVNYNEVY